MAARRLLILVTFLAPVTLLTAPATAECEQGCAEGWTQFGCRCYKFFNDKMSWFDAEVWCRTIGANLPSVHSVEQDAFLEDLVFNATGKNIQTWLGGTDSVVEGTWMWSDGSPWDFTNWPKLGSSGRQNEEGGGPNVKSVVEVVEEERVCSRRTTGRCRDMHERMHRELPPWEKFWNEAPNSVFLPYICAKDVPKTSKTPPEPEPEPEPELKSEPEPEPEPEPRSRSPVSVTLKGFVCHCTPQHK